MKKTLTAAALSSVLVLGLASSALAIHATETAETPMVAKGTTKVTIDGEVRERGAYDKNSASKDAAGNSWYDSKVQVGVKADVSPEATGYIKLESGTGTSDTETWGTDTGSSSLTTGGHKLGSPTILESWVNYKPGAWGVKAGHMPLALGNKVFFDHTGSGDDALVVYADPMETTHIGALTIKFDEQGTNNDGSDDLDGYVALITHKVNDNLKLGGNWTYLRGDSATGNAYNIGTFANDVFVLDQGAGQSLDGGMFPGLSMSNIGLTADGKVGAISYMADVEFQFGDAADIDNLDGTTTTVDAGGWAAKLGGDYNLGAGKVGLVFGYGSGTDLKDMVTDLTDGNNDVSFDNYINFLTDTTYDTIIAGYRAAIPGAGWGHNSKNTGLSNLTLYQLNGSTKTVCPLTGKDLSLFASASYMQLSEDTAQYNDALGNPVMVNNVGTELDVIATWQLTAGLNYKVEAAYLFVGDVYETAASGNGGDPDDLMFIRHGLDLKF